MKTPVAMLASCAIGLLLGCTAARAEQQTAESGTVVVTDSCSGGSTSCSVSVACPSGTTIQSSYWWWIVPDGVNPAYGICGSNSGRCTEHGSSCSFVTASSGCGNPGWGRQMGFLYAACSTTK
jgi:hypothetical protein